MENNYKVYIHNFPNGKVYIGITSKNENIRWRKNGEGYKKQFVYNAIKKYGWENIKHDILYSDLTKEQAEEKETELINMYKSNNSEYGYNIESGGHINCVSEKTKKKLSKANKGKVAWNKGQKMSEDFKEKCRKAKKGKGLNENLLNSIRKTVKCVETGIIYESILLASKKTKINVSNIAQNCKNKRKSAGGFHWEYVLEGEKNGKVA